MDENTAEEGEITEETTKPIAETIEPVAENEEGEIMEETTELVAETVELVAKNNFSVVIAQNLSIRVGRNRHPPVMLIIISVKDYLKRMKKRNFNDFMIRCILGKFSKAQNEDWLRMKKSNPSKKNQTHNLVVLSRKENKSEMNL